MKKLENRIAVITGAGRGIGRSIALAYASKGATLVLTARTTAELEEVSDEAAAHGVKSLIIPADLAEPAVTRQIIKQAEDEFGRVDILVNNAGVGSSGDPRPFQEFSDEYWDLTLAVNLTAPYLLCKSVLPGMLKRSYGRIITVASINGKIGVMHGVAYAASKHGVLGMTRTLAMEVARQGITVNAICPGPVQTKMNDIRIKYDAERRGMSVAELESIVTPIGRRLQPDEISPMAVYLASDGAAAVTGQAFNVDGGIVMTG